jgi:hypothetical protein
LQDIEIQVGVLGETSDSIHLVLQDIEDKIEDRISAAISPVIHAVFAEYGESFRCHVVAVRIKETS